MSCLPVLAGLISVSLLTGCATPESVIIRRDQEQTCARIEPLLEKSAPDSLPALQEIALSQNADVLLRDAKIEQYQSIERFLRHLQFSLNSPGVPVSLSGMLKLLTEIFKSGNPANDAELRELQILLRKAREQVIGRLADSVHGLQAERDKLAAAEEERKAAYADMVAANFIATLVPTIEAQEKADKAQRAHAKAEDQVRDRKQRAGELHLEIRQLTGCLDRDITAQK